MTEFAGHLDEDHDQLLFEPFRKLGFDMGMMYLRESTSGAAMTCYRPHCDKMSGGVVFLPLSQFFWTVVAYGSNDYKDDSEEFHRWRESLTDREKKKVGKILADALFKNKILSIYKCTPGTALAFDAENIAHATIIPKSFGRRKLCILCGLSIVQYVMENKRKRKRMTQQDSLGVVAGD